MSNKYPGLTLIYRRNLRERAGKKWLTTEQGKKNGEEKNQHVYMCVKTKPASAELREKKKKKEKGGKWLTSETFT